MKSLSHVRLSAIPWTAAHQAPLSTGFSRQEYWSGLPLPSPIIASSSHKTLLRTLTVRERFREISRVLFSFLIEEKSKGFAKVYFANLQRRSLSPLLPSCFWLWSGPSWIHEAFHKQAKDDRAENRKWVIHPLIQPPNNLSNSLFWTSPEQVKMNVCTLSHLQ